MAISGAALPAGNVPFVDSTGVLTTYGRNLLNALMGAPPVIRGPFDPVYANADFGLGNTTDPTDLALQNFFDAAADHVGIFESPSMVMYHTIPVYVRTGTRIEGNGATIMATATADINCTGVHLTDATWAGVGPSNVRMRDLKYNGNGIARRAGGHVIGVGQAAGFYLINASDVVLEDMEAADLVADGIYRGGTAAKGLTNDTHLNRCLVQMAGRNGFSDVGTYDVTSVACISKNHTFGATVGNISCGFDDEPNDTNSRNINNTKVGCIADTCSTAGFQASNNAFNSRVNWITPTSINNLVGYFASTAGGTAIAAARYSNNGTDFSGIAESISGYPGS